MTVRRWARRRCRLRRRPGSAPSGRALRAVTATVLVVAAVGAVASGLARVRTDSGAASFLPVGDPALRALHESASSFGGDPIVALVESPAPRQLLGPDELPQLLALEGRLARLPDTAAVYGPATVLNQVAAAGQAMMAGLSGTRDGLRLDAEQRARERGLSDAAVAAAGEAATREFDLRYGSLLVRGLPSGLPTLRNPDFVDTVLFERGGEPRPEWSFVLPAADAVALIVRPRQGLDQAGTERLLDAVRAEVAAAELPTRRLTVSGAPALATALGERVQREIVLLGGLAVALIGACYLLVPWLGDRRRRLVPLAATLAATALVLAAFGWLGRPLSLGLIAFLPILVGIGSDFPAYLLRGANRRRLLVAAGASAVGFGSLAVSPVPVVRDLGLALACGVVLSVALGLTLQRYRGTAPEPPADPPDPDRRRPVGRRAALLVAVGAVAAVGWAALPALPVEADPQRLAAGLPAVSDAQHVERVVGSSGEVQVSLAGPDVLTPAAIHWMRAAEDTIVLRFGSTLRPIVSLPELLRFLGPAPTPDQIHAAVRLLPPYLTGAVVRTDARRAIISLGVTLQDLDGQQRLLEDLRAALPPPPPGYTADVVGLPVAAARAYDLVSDNRYLANLLGLGLAGLVLVLGLRRRIEALAAVLAAALAAGWGLAAAWVLGLPLTPLTIALGSLATATACEFTVLLADRESPHRALLRRTVAVAAATAALGYLTLAASGLPMIRQFGVLLAGTVVLSLAAAHMVVRVLPVAEPASPTPAPTRLEVAR